MIFSLQNCAKLTKHWRLFWTEFLRDAFERSAIRHVEQAQHHSGLALRDQRKADEFGQQLSRLDSE